MWRPRDSMAQSMHVPGINVVESVPSSVAGAVHPYNNSDINTRSTPRQSGKGGDGKKERRSVDDLLTWDRQRRAKQEEALAAKLQMEEEALEKELQCAKPKLNAHSRWLVNAAADRRISAVDHAAMAGAALAADVQRTRSPAAVGTCSSLERTRQPLRAPEVIRLPVDS